MKCYYCRKETIYRPEFYDPIQRRIIPEPVCEDCFRKLEKPISEWESNEGGPYHVSSSGGNGNWQNIRKGESMNFDFEKLLKAIQDAETIAPGVALVVRELIDAFTGKAKMMASTIKCGPDGCTDPVACIDAAIAAEIQTLAALVQARKILSTPPNVPPAPAPIPAA